MYPENSTDESIDKQKTEFKKRYTQKLIRNINWEEVNDIFKEVERDTLEEELEKQASGGSDDVSDGDTDLSGDDDF
jgi:hypothetical protein